MVVEKEIGRVLDPVEVVHHRNSVRDDNRAENLFLFATNLDHGHYHIQVKKDPNFPLKYKYDYLHEKEIDENVE